MPSPPAWWAVPEGPTFVGRLSEISILEQEWAVAASGRRRVVFVLGEAGAGKSRLVAEVCRGFTDAGAAVLLGYCLPDMPVAYEPFRPAILSLMDTAETVVAPDRLPEVVDLLRSLALPGDTRATVGAQYVHRRFEAVLDVLRGVSADRPVVLVLEDLHWATPSTLALLSWLIRRLREGRNLILATARTSPPDRSAPLLAALGELLREPGVRRLELGGLATEEVARFVELETHGALDRSTPSASSLRELTAGNPYLLHEICRDIRSPDTQARQGTPARVPEAVRGLFAARMATLPDDEREIVELAAVLGEPVLVPLLDKSLPSPEHTLVAIEHAVDLGLLFPVADESGFRFPHALARQAVVDLIPPVRLAAHHGRAAEALEERSGGSLPEVQQLANHYRNAHGTTGKARYYLMRAAELSARALAYDEAARYYEQAAELADSAADRHTATLLAADCLQGAGRFMAARDSWARVARGSSDPAVRLAAAIGFEKSTSLLGGDVRAVELLGDALREGGVNPSDTTHIKALAGLGRALGQLGEISDAVRLNSVVVPLARAIGDDALLVHVLHRGLWVAFGHPELSGGALEAARELSGLARNRRDYEALGGSAFFRCLLGQRTGNRADVAEATNDLRIAAERTAHHWLHYWAGNAEYGTRFLHGDFAGAEHIAQELRRVSADWPEAEAEGHYGVQMFMVCRETGHLDGLRPHVSGNESPTSHWAPGLLAIYTELGMAAPARRLLDTLAAKDVLEANRDSEYWPAALAFLVEAALFLKDSATLRRLRPRLAEHAGLNLVSEQFVTLCGSADRYIGMVDSVLGQGDPIARFDAAEELNGRTGSDVHLAWTLTSRARHLAAVDAGSRDLAQTIERARAVAAPIGQGRVLGALDAIERTPTGSHTTSWARLAGITPRELDVLRLLVAGATNRDIADALIISPNTAANHVRSILTKTGTTSRTKAVHYALTHGWVGSEAGSAQPIG